MSLQPLTSEGVAAKIAELYALSDSLLAVQANQAAQNFRLWVVDNFTLSEQEEDYLYDLNNDMVAFLASRLSFYFMHRVPVLFSRQLPPPVGAIPFKKWLSFADSTTISTTEDTGSPVLNVDGSVIISIIYLPESL